jgi:hypothetical protein
MSDQKRDDTLRESTLVSRVSRRTLVGGTALAAAWRACRVELRI